MFHDRCRTLKDKTNFVVLPSAFLLSTESFFLSGSQNKPQTDPGESSFFLKAFDSLRLCVCLSVCGFLITMRLGCTAALLIEMLSFRKKIQPGSSFWTTQAEGTDVLAVICYQCKTLPTLITSSYRMRDTLREQKAKIMCGIAWSQGVIHTYSVSPEGNLLCVNAWHDSYSSRIRLMADLICLQRSEDQQLCC